jgi:hypothetical protein
MYVDLTDLDIFKKSVDIFVSFLEDDRVDESVRKEYKGKMATILNEEEKNG